MSTNLKTFRKGESLLKEGEKNLNVYLIQSGLVSICVSRDNKKVELYRSGSGQVIGDEMLTSAIPAQYSVIAINETKAYEVPADMIRQQVEAGNPMIKLLVKGLVEKQKTATTEVKTFKMEQDPSPCPADNTAKVYGVIYHVANSMGTKKDNKVTVQWPAFKKYAQRVFLESPLRLEQAFYVLVKLKIAEKQMVKNEIDPTAPEELGFFHILNMKAIERFFDYYQNYHFKPGYSGFLKYDEKCMQTAKALLKFSGGEKIDHRGCVLMNWKTTLDKFKTEFGAGFSPDAVERLAQKGLMVKRESSATGGAISFLKSEFEEMIENWKILKEIEKWNELGHVDMTEPKPVAVPGAAAAQPDGPVLTCPQCMSIVSQGQKFCGQCGNKVEMAA